MSERWSNATVVDSTTVTTLLIWSGWSDIPPIWILVAHLAVCATLLHDQDYKRGDAGR